MGLNKHAREKDLSGGNAEFVKHREVNNVHWFKNYMLEMMNMDN